eukprot:1151993-Pelagomonas_calceolata.AAC.1
MHASGAVPYAHGRGPQGVWRQTCSKPFQTSRIMTMQDAPLHGEVRRAGMAPLLQLILEREGKGRSEPKLYLFAGPVYAEKAGREAIKSLEQSSGGCGKP